MPPPASYPLGVSAATDLYWDRDVTLRGLTGSQYDFLVEAGEFEGQDVELIEGAVVEMAPQGPEHSRTIGRLATTLARALPETMNVRPQKPLATSPFARPEPDIAVIDAAGDIPGSGHPSTAHLVVEVAVSSQKMDLVHKARAYAGAGVGQYWVVDLPSAEVVVHTSPGDRGYASVQRIPLDTDLTVLGITLNLAEVLS